MTLPIIVIGGGGHSRVLIDMILMKSSSILGFTDVDQQLHNSPIQGVRYLGDDNEVYKYSPADILLVNAIGSIGSTKMRKQIYETFKSKGYSFASCIHPSAIISSEVILAEGVQIMAGTIIQTGSQIGVNTIINTRSSVDHGCVISPHVHVAPGVTLSGGVRIGTGAHIGSGSTVIQEVCLHEFCIIGAGAVVLEDVPAHRTYVGVPAKEVRK